MSKALQFSTALAISLFGLYASNSFKVTKQFNAKVINFSSNSMAFCYLNPDYTLGEVITTPSRFCAQILPKDTYSMITYASHRFYVFPWSPQHRADFTPQIITMFPSVTEYRLRSTGLDAIDVSLFDRFVEYWGSLCGQRHKIGASFAIVLLGFSYIFASQTNKLHHSTSFPASHRQIYAPRASLKCLATVAMLLNHVGHFLFVKNNFQKQVLTFPADIGLSSHLYWWLAGFGSGRIRSSDSQLLVAYLLLLYIADLPSPFTYETLLNVATIRLITSWAPMKTLSESNVLVHGVLCCALLISGLLFDSDCLKILHTEGLALGISSNLLTLHTDALKRLIWVFPVIMLIFYKNYTRLTTDKDINNLNIFQYSYFGIWTLISVAVHSAVLFVPVAKSAWKSSNLTEIISRYSLEIYVVHILILYIMQLFYYDKFAGFVYK
jgi:hypothetical protein